MKRRRFSQREGINPVRVEIQRESMDEPLRNLLWSVVVSVFLGDDYRLDSTPTKLHDMANVVIYLWINFFEQPIDTIPVLWENAGIFFREKFFKWQWFNVYDFIELLAQAPRIPKKEFIDTVNTILEKEMSAYRFIGDEIGEITDETEIQAIVSAIASTEKLSPVNIHLRDALAKLIDRTNPDYRNSIKESISAVEAMCQHITGDKNATLGEAIKNMKDAGIIIHPAIERAWLSLYGYTSNADGIRHVLLDEPDLTFGTAKYMHVSCSAFINYLVVLQI